MLNSNYIKYLSGFYLNSCSNNLSYFKHLLGNFSLKLRLLDEISRKLCFLSDNCSIFNVVLRNNHIQKTDFSKELDNVSILINEYMNKLNCDEVIYNTLLSMKYHETSQFLNTEEHQILNNMINDYEDKYGILNKKREKNSISQVLQKEELLKERFENNIYQNKEKIEFPSDCVNFFKDKNVQIKRKLNGCLEIECNSKIILSFIQETDDPRLKIQLFQKYFNSNINNKDVIADLLKTRCLYSQMISPSESFAGFSLRMNSILGKFFNIDTLLELLSRESILLRKNLNDYLEKTTQNKINIIKLFELLIKKSSNQEKHDLTKTIDFICCFFESYAFIRLEWSFSHLENVPQIQTIHFNVHNKETGISCGTIILILSRLDVTQTMIAQANSMINPLENIKTKPKMYLMFDFFKNKNIEMSLNSSQIRNIVHEMTHALHNILSYHDFQYISNNTRLDYAEVMAILFENIFIQYFKQKNHYVSEDFIKSSIEKLEQIYFALIDLRFHNEKSFLTKSHDEIIRKTNEINTKAFEEVFGEYDTEKLLTPNHYYCCMLHLSTYPSLYYSYSLGYILFEEFSKKKDYQRSLFKMLNWAHKTDAFYLILKEILI